MRRADDVELVALAFGLETAAQCSTCSTIYTQQR